VDLTEAHMEALLWLVGEYGVRAGIILDLLNKHKDELWDGVMFARAKLALEMMERLVCGERMDLDELCRRLREGERMDLDELCRRLREAVDQVMSRYRDSEQPGSDEQGATPDPGRR
jgi:hypothetical protein